MAWFKKVLHFWPLTFDFEKHAQIKILARFFFSLKVQFLLLVLFIYLSHVLKKVYFVEIYQRNLWNTSLLGKGLLDFVFPNVKLHNKDWYNQGCPHISLPLCTYLTAFCIFPFEITFLIHRPINVLQIRASQSDSLHDQSHRKNLLMRDRWKLVTPQSNLKIL